jgi:peptide/nickel transport system permease protein
MAKESIISTRLEEANPRMSEMRRLAVVFFRRKLVIAGLVIIFILVITAIFAPLIAPYDPYKQDISQALLQPGKAHLLGTDVVGRDTLSRVIYASRTSLIIGIIAITIAASVGMALGLIAAYFGGVTSALIMRFIDALMSFPMLVFALVLASMLGSGLKNVILALGIGMIAGYARLMCGQALSVKQNEYVTAARSMGASNLRIMLVHILTNCFPPLIVLITMTMGTCILAEAGLSFLGLGITPPGAAWGAMVNEGYKYLLTNPVLSFAPGVAIMLTVFAFNMVGDGLRDALDPRLRGSI